MDRRSLSLDDAKAPNPKVPPITEMPERGPPLLIQGYSNPESNRRGYANAKERLTPRVTPPRDYAPRDYPEIPPARTMPPVPVQPTAPVPRQARPPTPSQLRIPGNERPPSLEDPTYAEQHEYEKMRIVSDVIRNLPPWHLNLEPLPLAPRAEVQLPFAKAPSLSIRHIAPPLAVLPSQTAQFPTEMPATFAGFQEAQFRPPQPRVRPPMPPTHSPYVRREPPMIQPNQVMTYAEVEAMIDALLHPPPQSMLSPQRAYAGSPDPIMGRLTYEARAPIGADITTIEDQLALPHNAKYEDLVNRARTFGQPPP